MAKKRKSNEFNNANDVNDMNVEVAEEMDLKEGVEQEASKRSKNRSKNNNQ